MKIKALLLTIFLVLCCSHFSYAQTEEKIKVKIESVGDYKINREVAKYVNKALNKILDVEIVDDNPRVYVHIIVRRLITNRGRRLGYVISAASSEIIEAVVDGGYQITFSDYNGLWLETGPDLRLLCDQCVSAVNSGVLSSLRNLKKTATK